MSSISDATDGISPQCASLSKYFRFGAKIKTTCFAFPEINNSSPQGPLGFLKADCPSKNKMSGFLKETLERKVIDGAVNGTGKLVQYGARQIRLIQSGQVGYYILFMVLSLVLMIVLWFNDIAILRFLFKLTQK